MKLFDIGTQWNKCKLIYKCITHVSLYIYIIYTLYIIIWNIFFKSVLERNIFQAIIFKISSSKNNLNFIENKE